MVWYGMVWHSMVRYGMVWYGKVRQGDKEQTHYGCREFDDEEVVEEKRN